LAKRPRLSLASPPRRELNIYEKRQAEKLPVVT
jgi:hypothetical protein